MSDRRDEFLMAMYGEMWENINRHIVVVWQSVGVLAGAFAALIVGEQTAVSLDVSATIVAVRFGASRGRCSRGNRHRRCA